MRGSGLGGPLLHRGYRALEPDGVREIIRQAHYCEPRGERKSSLDGRFRRQIDINELAEMLGFAGETAQR